jgi:hypothetical protein
LRDGILDFNNEASKKGRRLMILDPPLVKAAMCAG